MASPLYSQLRHKRYQYDTDCVGPCSRRDSAGICRIIFGCLEDPNGLTVIISGACSKPCHVNVRGICRLMYSCLLNGGWCSWVSAGDQSAIVGMRLQVKDRMAFVPAPKVIFVGLILPGFWEQQDLMKEWICGWLKMECVCKVGKDGN